MIVLPLFTAVAAPLMEDLGLLPRTTHGPVEEQETGQATPCEEQSGRPPRKGDILEHDQRPGLDDVSPWHEPGAARS